MEQRNWRASTALGATLLATPACCVCSSTRVRTPDGTRPIGELEVGDLVLSLAIESGELVPARVVGRRTARRECVRLAYPGGELVCTPDHPIYSPETGEYEPASRWVEGACRAVLVAGERPAAAPVDRAEAFVGVREVVDISVDAPMHNFVAEGLVVHNKSYITMIYGYAEGPEFSLTAAEPIAEFQIRACVVGKDPSAEAYASYVDMALSSRDEPPSSMGEMWFAVYFPEQAADEATFDDAPSQEGLFVHLGTMERMCTSPLSINFERLDGLPDGEISFTWHVSGATEPPSGTSVDDRMHIEIAR